MNNQRSLLLARGRNDAGASLIEYALLVALVAVVSLSALNYLGTAVEGDFKNLNHQGFAASGGICLSNPNDPSCP
jgi:Flp pilus assembly pilin Flp